MRFLFVDRIVQLVPGSMIRGIKHITQDDGYLYKDEQGHGYFASSLIGETLGQLAAWNVMFTNEFTKRPVAGIVSSARLYRQAYVGETLLLESIIDSLDEHAVEYHSVARVGDDVVFTVEGALGPLLPMENFINKEEVRQQFNEIHRPGEWSDYLELSFVDGKALTNQVALKPLTMAFDKLIQCEPDVSMTAVKHISRSAPYFPDHFPDNPVLPMTVLLECKLHLAQVFLQQSSFKGQYQVSELRKIKMNEFVYPGDVLYCYVSVLQKSEQQLILRFRSEVDKKRVCIVDVVMTQR
ncbi:(3R)-hydroxymyristoyl-ACP dehydratase [Legionella beliardensis]|uniref:(3R)-hydroxymyristoyl-ACP dehydratase n=1 Tax=Legionella beliardensis TaxID=91822 RepID=A0A378HZ48_9GAMM|nr:hydroxymyristoyl-ACP dehydratase [Legionella beliardensis]STX27781.1 (3R)-hydroxymyristoyl-ACP dehydratase [Legionella beliardensis]